MSFMDGIKDYIPQSTLWTLFAVIVTTLAAAIWERWHHFRMLKNLGYSGPSPNILLGNLKDFLKASGEFPKGWQNLFDMYGTQVGNVKGKCLAMYMGRKPCIIISDPDLIKTIGIKKFDNFRNRMFCDIGKGLGVLAARDQAWKNARYTLAPSFSQAKMKLMSSAMNKCLNVFLDILEEHAELETPVNFLKVSRALTMEVICKCGFALEVNAQREKSHRLITLAIKVLDDFGFNSIKRFLITVFPTLTTFIIRVFNLAYAPSEKEVLQYMKNFIHERIKSPENTRASDALYFMLEAAHLIGSEENNSDTSISSGQNMANNNNGKPCLTQDSSSECCTERNCLDSLVQHSADVSNSEFQSAESVTQRVNSRTITNSLKHSGVTTRIMAQEVTPNATNRDKDSGTESQPRTPAISANNVKKEPTRKTRVPLLSEDEVVGNAFLLLLAGYETTSAALTFTTYLLAKHPMVQQRLFEEIASSVDKEENLTYDLVNQLQYLDMVLNESLRCYPPAGHVVTREVDKDFEYEGLKFPAKSYVFFPIAYMHYNKDLWDNPTQFDPERFHPDKKKDIHPAAFMPFGIGPRQCMGTKFALTELKLAISRLVFRYRLEFCHLTEKELKTRASLLVVTPASNELYLSCCKR